MKQFIALLIILACVPALYSKDYKETEDIINEIIRETPDAPAGDGILPATVKPLQGEGEPPGEGEEETGAVPGMTGPDEVLLKTGIEFFESELYPQAGERFRELKEKYPQSRYRDSASLWLGRLYIKEYEYGKAITELQAIPEISGEYPRAIYLIADASRTTGKNTDAIEYYNRLAFRFPTHDLADNALLNIATIYMKEEKGDKALKFTVRLIKFYKDRETVDDAYYLLAKIYEKDPTLKDIETARRVYRLFLARAEKGDNFFRNSPLKKRVQQDLAHLEKRFFKLEY